MVCVLVELTIRAGQRPAFDAYERQVLAIASRHGGRLVCALIPEDADGAGYDELHVLEFPDRVAFDDFLGDPERNALSALRDDVISASKIRFASRNARL